MSSSDSTTLYLVRPESLAQAWPEVEPLVREVCEVSGLWSPEDVRVLIASGRWTLFVAMGEGCEAILTGELIQYPRMRVFAVYVCHGKNHARWTHHLDRIEDWAASQGCGRIDPLCRDGWAKLLKSRGYTTTHRQMTKLLPGNTVAEKTQ